MQKENNKRMSTDRTPEQHDSMIIQTINCNENSPASNLRK